jgi:hypothetical protein
VEAAKLVISVLALLISIVAVVVASRTAFEVKKRDLAHDRRRLFITSLWDRLTAVRGINKENVNRDLVLDTLNTLELVALCWNADVADRDLIFRSFADSYCRRTMEIESLTVSNGYPQELFVDIGMDGPALLRGPYIHVRALCDELARMQSEQRARLLAGGKRG